APVGELDHGALVRGQFLECAVDAPGYPALLCLLRRAGGERLLLGRLDRRLAAGAAAVDDRVPRDGVEPGAAGAALGLVRAGRAPDRREGLLDGVLGAPAVAEAAQGEAEHRPRVALV